MTADHEILINAIYYKKIFFYLFIQCTILSLLEEYSEFYYRYPAVDFVRKGDQYLVDTGLVNWP